MTTGTSNVTHMLDSAMTRNALVWAATIVIATVVATASEAFLYVLIVLVMGALLSSVAIARSGTACRPRHRSGA